jgi:predicted dehydrogenase
LCIAIGNLGSLRWNGIVGTVELWASGTKSWHEVYKHHATSDESYLAEWNNFLACIKQGTKPLIAGEDGLKVLSIIEAARLANKTNSQVNVAGVNEL